LHLNDSVVGFENYGDQSLSVRLKSGLVEETDLVILAIGMRPEIYDESSRPSADDPPSLLLLRRDKLHHRCGSFDLVI
jgi:hypothetical protein